MNDEDESGDESSGVSLNDLSANHHPKRIFGINDGDKPAPIPVEIEAASGGNDPTEKAGNYKTGIGGMETGEDQKYHTYDDETTQLWNKAMATLENARSQNSSECHPQALENDDDINSGVPEAEGNLISRTKSLEQELDDYSNDMKNNQTGGKVAATNNNPMLLSSDYSIDGESAIVWGDDPEKAYFAYMMEQEQEKRAHQGKDEKDSLLGASTQEEVLNRIKNFDDQDGRLTGWASVINVADDTASESIVTSQYPPSTNTTSILSPVIVGLASKDQLASDENAEFPDVIYVQDGSDATPFAQMKIRSFKERKKPSEKKASSFNDRFTTPHVPLGDDESDIGVEEAQAPHPRGQLAQEEDKEKSGWPFNRVLVAAAACFVVITSGLVVALLVYRSYYNRAVAADAAAAEAAALAAAAGDRDDFLSRLQAPTFGPTVAPNISTNNPTQSLPLLSKKEEDTWPPTGSPTWSPSLRPSFHPTKRPTRKPTVSSRAPSILPTQEPTVKPTKAPTTKRPTRLPTQLPTMALTMADTSDSPSVAITFAATTYEPTVETTVGTTSAVASPTDRPAATTTAPVLPITVAPVAPTGSPVAPTRAPSSGFTVTLQVTSQPAPVPTMSPVAATPAPTKKPAPAPTESPVATPVPTKKPVPAATDPPVATPAPTKRPTKLPSTPPVSAAASTPAPTFFAQFSPISLENVRQFLLGVSPMSTEALFDEASAPFLAMQWLTEWMEGGPADIMSQYSNERLTHRWVMGIVYFGLGGNNWLQKDGWMGNRDACRWLTDNNHGSCNEQGLVQTFLLTRNNLQGTLPKEIALLSNSLVRFEVNRNDISGPMPTQLGRLTNLVSFDANRCDMTGTIPRELGNLSRLAILRLGRNDFRGTIPTELRNLQDLEILGLERNDIAGTIPLQLTILQKLEYLALDYNELTGTVPSALANLSNLNTLIVARNHLVGEIANAFCDRGMTFMAADCSEVSCPCCDLCCTNGQSCAST